MKPLRSVVLFATVLLVAPSAEAAPAPEAHLLESYVTIQKALAADSLVGVKDASTHLAHGAGLLKARDPTAFARLKSASKQVGGSKDLTAARTAFKELSAAVLAVSDRGLLGAHALVAIHCPMAKASWLQEGSTVKNPFYGKSMLSCGTVRPAPTNAQ